MFAKIQAWLKAQLIKVFGKHWRTSIYAVLAAIPQVSSYIVTYLGTLDVPQKYLNLMTLLFGLCCAFSAADSHGGEE